MQQLADMVAPLRYVNNASVVFGGEHTCALSVGGAVACWGNNDFGQTAVPGNASRGQVAVAAGLYHACALSAGGAVACWGDNSDGQTAVPGPVAAGGQVLAAIKTPRKRQVLLCQ
jgi:alpha-tubulin suppressor-like RCC1 family protein